MLQRECDSLTFLVESRLILLHIKRSFRALGTSPGQECLKGKAEGATVSWVGEFDNTIMGPECMGMNSSTQEVTHAIRAISVEGHFTSSRCTEGVVECSAFVIVESDAEIFCEVYKGSIDHSAEVHLIGMV